MTTLDPYWICIAALMLMGVINIHLQQENDELRKRDTKRPRSDDGVTPHYARDIMQDDDISSSFIAGMIMQARGSISKNEKEPYTIRQVVINRKVHFAVEGELSESLRLRYKDGNDVKVIPLRNKITVNDITVYIPDDNATFIGYIRCEERPHEVAYISAMPDGHPELETFFIKQ